WEPAAQLIAMRDDHCGICDKHRVDVGGDDVVPVPQHEGPITVIDEFLLELSQRGLWGRVETFHNVAGFVLNQAAHRQGDPKFSGLRFGGVDRVRTLDGKDGLFDLMWEEPATAREYSLRQVILAVRLVHDAPPRGIFVSSAAHTRQGSNTRGSALFRRRNSTSNSPSQVSS